MVDFSAVTFLLADSAPIVVTDAGSGVVGVIVEDVL